MADDVALADQVAFLGAAESHALERPERVEAIEPHMSWVFLTDRFAYELKKPVGHPLSDLRSLAARRRNCLAEILLIRRLAPGVYLGIRPLTLAEGTASLRPCGAGRVVDWRVVMRRGLWSILGDEVRQRPGPRQR